MHPPAQPPAPGSARADRSSRLHLIGLFVKMIADRIQHRQKPGPAVRIHRRKISPAPERLKLRRQKNAHRPAALMRHHLHRRHVKLIHIRPLFAIDLDADEFLVHHLGDERILKALPLHHVTPVTGAVTDREKDRLVLRPRRGECFRPPGVPIHGIVRVLEEVGGGFVDEAVGGRRIHFTEV